MKSERHQGNALTGASIKITNICYNKYKCKNPDRSELLTKDLKVATDCTVSGVIFSEFQGAMTRSRKNVYVGWYNNEWGTVSIGVPWFYVMSDSEHFGVVHTPQ